MFNEEPELFLPQYGGYCAYAISLGKLVTVDPDVYVVLDEKLFLFSNEEARTAFEDKEPGIVAVADEQWKTMESERAQKRASAPRRRGASAASRRLTYERRASDPTRPLILSSS